MITRDVRHTHNLLIKHILAVRQIPELAHTTMVFVFERCVLLLAVPSGDH